MTATMDLISEQVLTSAASSVTFSSIPQGFKDLVLEITGSVGSASLDNILCLRVNGNTSSIYSGTLLVGDGTSAASSRYTTSQYSNSFQGKLLIWRFNNPNQSGPTSALFHINSYSNTNVFKTVIGSTKSAITGVFAIAGLIQTANAVTSLTVLEGEVGQTIAAGSVLRLWGVVG